MQAVTSLVTDAVESQVHLFFSPGTALPQGHPWRHQQRPKFLCLNQSTAAQVHRLKCALVPLVPTQVELPHGKVL